MIFYRYVHIYIYTFSDLCDFNKFGNWQCLTQIPKCNEFWFISFQKDISFTFGPQSTQFIFRIYCNHLTHSRINEGVYMFDWSKQGKPQVFSVILTDSYGKIPNISFQYFFYTDVRSVFSNSTGVEMFMYVFVGYLQNVFSGRFDTLIDPFTFHCWIWLKQKLKAAKKKKN